MRFIKVFKPLTVIATVIILFISGSAFAQDKQQRRIDAATAAITDFQKMKESIPSELLALTQGIVIIPKLINAGFVVGGKRGRGVAMIKKSDGSWSNPVFITMTGGSVGPQIGIQSVDLVLVFKHASSLSDIKKSSFTLGGDLSVSAGPVGRSSTANTDYKLDAEVYSYSRSKGLFAGISLNGASLAIDQDANSEFYGQRMSVKEIFSARNSTEENVQKLKSSLSDLK